LSFESQDATHIWDPILFTYMEYIKLNRLTYKFCLQQWDT